MNVRRKAILLIGIMGFFALCSFVRNPEEDTWKIIFGLGAFAMGLLFYEEKNKKVRQDKEDIKFFQKKYPMLASNISLLLQSGMSPKSAFLYIEGQYKDKEDLLGKELQILKGKLISGYSERLAYKEFGEACKGWEYRRLMSLVMQYLEQGTKHIAVLLELEVKEASGNRLRMAKKAGEELSTKMLLPMGLLLLDVIIMVIAPVVCAVSSFQNL